MEVGDMDRQKIVHNRRFTDQTLFYLALQLWKWILVLPILFYYGSRVGNGEIRQYLLYTAVLYGIFRLMQYLVASRATLMELLEIGFSLLAIMLDLLILTYYDVPTWLIVCVLLFLTVHPTVACLRYHTFKKRKWLNKQSRLFGWMLQRGEIPVHVLVLTEDEIIITAKSGKEFVYRHIYWGGYYFENIT